MSAYGHLPHFRSVSFTVHGLPAPQGSKRHVGRGVMVESSKRVKPWRGAVKAAAESAMWAWEKRRPLEAGVSRAWEPLTGPVSVTVTFRFPRAASHYGTGRNAASLRADAPTRPADKQRGDLEKLIRSTHDALTAAGVWVDDAQVVHVDATKCWCVAGEKPGATITVREAL